MTTRTLRNSQSLSFLVGIGESLKVVAADGTYTATVTDGVAKGTVLATNATGGTYGPYAYQAQVLLVASASSEIDFDVAVTPVVDTDTQAYCTFDTSGNISGLVSKAGKSVTLSTALAPVSLSGNTTLTRAAHYNRLIVVDVSGGNVTLTATGTDALLGDFIFVGVIGGGSNTVTLAGVTAKPGYRLTANNGEVVELCCVAPGNFVPVTPETAALVESLSALRVLTALDDKKRFTCTTALTIEVPTGLSPAPSCIAVPPATGNLTLSPTGGATFNGSASALTRTFANNRNGVLIEPSPYTANDYSVSGS